MVRSFRVLVLTRLRNKKIFMKKVILIQCMTKWNAKKQNSKQAVIKIGQSRLNMQAVPPAGSTYYTS